jgi:CHAD domain-containing protein
MRPVVRPGFVVADGVARDLDELLSGVREALSTAFAVASASPPRHVTRTWLDTFDWRLYRAGLTLEHRGGELILADETVQRVPRWRPGRPAGPGRGVAIPDGPIADRIAGIIEPRALLPVAVTRSALATLALLNSDEKTVARVEIECPDTGLARITIGAIRGYAAQAGKAATILEHTEGIEPATIGPLEAAAQRPPGGYTGKVDAPIEGRQPAPVAVSIVLLNLLDTLEANVDGVIRDIDTEFLHDLRVSVRRTRSALKLLGAAVPDPADHFKNEFKWLGDMTTPVRDLDVHLLELGDAPGDLEPLRAHLARTRTREFRRLTRELRSPRFAAVTGNWRKALTEARDARWPRSTPTATVLAAATIGKANARVLKMGGGITSDSPPEALHDLRKRAKELRYALEFFASLKNQQGDIASLKKLQDCLGEFQDTEVQIDEIRRQADAMLADRAHPVPASVFLAMGELIAGLHQRQRAARADFDRRFAVFAGNDA